jgi:integrase/recombinase XerD
MNETCDGFLEYASLERKLADSTLSAYASDLASVSSWLQERGFGSLGCCDTGQLAEYAAWLSFRGYSALSVRRRLSTLRGFFRFLQGEGIRGDNPAEALHPPRLPLRLPHAVSVDAVTSLVEAWTGDTVLSVRNRALMELAYGAGLRESELTGMTVGRVYLEEALVRPMGKGSRERLVPIGGMAVRWLASYIDQARPRLLHGKTSPVLFLSYRGNPLTRMTVWDIVREAATAAGLGESIHPHTLRHSFATHLLQGGADLRVVQELLGHADIRTTEIYTSLDRTFLRGVIERCHPRSAGWNP